MTGGEALIGSSVPGGDPLRPGAAEALVRWFSQEGRDLAWRSERDAWLILVSEVMSQQTQVERVVPAWERFIERFPDPEACASAGQAEVVRLWRGLGYPRRARDLHRASRLIVDVHAGRVPDSLDGLLGLPGVGPYTARAVLAFAHERDVGVLDTNVGRILARISGRALGATEAQTMADELVPPGQAWVWNQALLDLGADVCRKRQPTCGSCPIAFTCRWAGEGCPEPDPALRSAAVSRPQSRFEGSLRQVRGRVLATLETGSASASALSAVDGGDGGRLAAALGTLISDGLIEVVEPGSASDALRPEPAALPRSPSDAPRPGKACEIVYRLAE